MSGLPACYFNTPIGRDLLARRTWWTTYGTRRAWSYTSQTYGSHVTVHAIAAASEN